MKTYIDNDYLIAKDTIIKFSSDASTVDVPGKFEQINVKRIGENAFSSLYELKYVSLPYGVESIGDWAFSGNCIMEKIRIPGTVKHFGKGVFSRCHQLKEIEIYDIKIHKNTYLKMKNNSIRFADDVYVAKNVPKFMSDTGFNYVLPAVSIPDDIVTLFRFYSDTEGYLLDDLFENIDGISAVENEDLLKEHAAFVYQIKNNNFVKASCASENANDAMSKKGKSFNKTETYIFTFDDTKTKSEGEYVYITAIIKSGYFFWQSGQKVIYNKKDYYVYRRMFLSGFEDYEYVREDVAVYKDTKLLLNKEEAQQVYAKYKLLSIL